MPKLDAFSPFDPAARRQADKTRYPGAEEILHAPAPPQNEITVSPDGPLFVRGRIFVQDSEDGADAPQTQVALCRCGASRNKPYCDGSHSKVRFVDAGGVASEPSAERSGVTAAGDLTIVAFPDGPLKITGPALLRAASGRVAANGERLFLCRCGNSKNRPYCDGAHKALGFRSVEGDGR